MKKKSPFQITRVVTRDLVTDWFQGLRNMFGMRLRGYEAVINKHLNQMLEEMNLKYKVDWFRVSINPLTNESVMIVIYGEIWGAK